MTARLLLFWDYDTQWGADRSRSAGGPKDWGGLDFTYTEELLEILDQYGVQACFAVVGAAALPGARPYHAPDQIRRIHDAGHEVASHSLHHEWLPGLGREALVENLRASKEAIENCTGTKVVSFVPPFNQPFDYPARLSFSLSERREAGPRRVGLEMLCSALARTGYGFCRVAYRSLWRRLGDRIAGPRRDGPVRLEHIAGIACARMNLGMGFDERVSRQLSRSVDRGGIFIAAGHPHSLHSGGTQDRRHLIDFLSLVRALRRDGRLQPVRPAEAAGL